MDRPGEPSIVVDCAVAGDLEVLGGPPLLRAPEATSVQPGAE
jgi:hypothetical protein